MKADEINLEAIDSLIEKSVRTATPAVADSVAYPERQMTAQELQEFWRNVSLVAMATVGTNGQPHIAPVHARLKGASLRVFVYENAVRRSDLHTNPRVAFTTWDNRGAVVIIYGRAAEVPGSRRPARPGRSGKERYVVEFEVKLTRIYAMRPPAKRLETT